MNLCFAGEIDGRSRGKLRNFSGGKCVNCVIFCSSFRLSVKSVDGFVGKKQ